MNDPGRSMVRVVFSSREDARRLVFRFLEEFPAGKRARVAARIVAELQACGLLGRAIEQHYSATDAARLLGRSAEFVAKRARRGEFGRVHLDGGGWIIPASGIQAWLEARALDADKVAGKLKTWSCRYG